MKQLCYRLAVVVFFALALHSTSNAQAIPNGGFETWAGGDPAGWLTTNDDTLFVNVTKSTDAHSGSAAVRGEVKSIGPGLGFPPGLLTEPAFALNSRPAAIQGWYKTSLLGGDVVHIVVVLAKADTGIGGTAITINTSSSVYQQFSSNIGILSEETPDSAIISVQISGSAGLANVGSYFILDDLAWGAATAVSSSDNTLPDRFALEQNYPNPFNPTTTIKYELPAQSGVDGNAANNVRLVVYDMLGREAAVLVDAKQGPGTYETKWNASGAASGVYLYRLSVYSEGSQTPSFVQTKLMTLVR
jgi:hypothetical protein